jgi:hypothetical protein
MSTSRSPTPIPNTASSNIPSPTERTTSRIDSHDHTLSAPPPEPHSSRPHSHSYPLAPTWETFQSRDRHMAQKLSKDSHHQEDAHSSYSSDSHEDHLADNEKDQLADSQETAPPAPPPKKKRTRTLTTPHQSAVLHALLAQSRFPSTAVREEVGRSIGLSARKVQIWFQNQRQKARRPHGLADPSRKRPPQYGPFPPSASDTSVAGSSMVDHRAVETTYRYQYGGMTSDQPAYSGYHSDSPAQLSGPGIPGTDYTFQLPSIGRPSTAPSRPCDDDRSSAPFSRLGSTYPTATHDYDRRPSTSASHYAAAYDRESRTLPPLTAPSRRESSSPISSRGLPLLSFTSPRTSLLPSSSQSYLHDLPEIQASRYSPPRTMPPFQRDTLPPPLRLRSPSPYASSSSHHLHVETPPPSASPTQEVFGHSTAISARGSTEETSPRPPGRYDPVRGAFIPTPTPSEGHKSRSPSPST